MAIMKKKPGIRVVVSPIVGISLGMYNKGNGHYQEQDLINDALMEINHWIKHKNAISHLATPMID